MSITLTPAGGTAIALPPDLLWANEMDWSPVAQAKGRSITGALIVDVAVRIAGRPILLQGSATSAWLSRQALKALRALAAQPVLEMELSWNGELYTVFFDHGDSETSSAVAAQPVIDYSDPLDPDYYHSLQLRFLTK